MQISRLEQRSGHTLAVNISQTHSASSGDTTQPPSSQANYLDTAPNVETYDISTEPGEARNASVAPQTEICNEDMDKHCASRLFDTVIPCLVASAELRYSPTSGTLCPCPSVFDGAHSQAPCKVSGPSARPSSRSERACSVTLPHVHTDAQVKRTRIDEELSTVDIHNPFIQDSVVDTATTSHPPPPAQSNSCLSKPHPVQGHAPCTKPCYRPCFPNHTAHVKTTNMDTRHRIATSVRPFIHPQNNSPPDNMPVLSALPFASSPGTGPLARNSLVSNTSATAKKKSLDHRPVNLDTTGPQRNEPNTVASCAAANISKHRHVEPQLGIADRSVAIDVILADVLRTDGATCNNYNHRGQSSVSPAKNTGLSSHKSVGKTGVATEAISSLNNLRIPNALKVPAGEGVVVRHRESGPKTTVSVADGLGNNVKSLESVQTGTVNVSTELFISKPITGRTGSSNFVKNQKIDGDKDVAIRNSKTGTECEKVVTNRVSPTPRGVGKTKRKASKVISIPSKRTKLSDTVGIVCEPHKVGTDGNNMKSGKGSTSTTARNQNGITCIRPIKRVSVTQQHGEDTRKSNHCCEVLTRSQETCLKTRMGWNEPCLQLLSESAERVVSTRCGNVKASGKQVNCSFGKEEAVKNSGTDKTFGRVLKHRTAQTVEPETVQSYEKGFDGDEGMRVQMCRLECDKLLLLNDRLHKENEALRLGVVDKVVHEFETKCGARGKAHEGLEGSLGSRWMDTIPYIPGALRVLESVEVASKVKMERANVDEVYGIWMEGLAKVEDWGVESIVQMMRLVRKHIGGGSPLNTKVQGNFKSACCGIVSQLLSHSDGIDQKKSGVAMVRSGSQGLQELLVTFLESNSDVLWSNVIFTDVLRSLMLPLLRNWMHADSGVRIQDRDTLKRNWSIDGQGDKYTENAAQLVLNSLSVCSRKVEENCEQSRTTNTLCKRNVRTICRRIAASAGCMVTLAKLSGDKYNSKKPCKQVIFGGTREDALLSYDYLSMRFYKMLNHT